MRSGCLALLAWLFAFFRARHGGTIFAGGMLLFAVALLPGSMLMVNHAWREAQWEELRSAERAAVAAAGALLAGAGDPQTDDEISETVARVAAAQMPGLRIGTDDVDIAHDPLTDLTTVTVRGTYEFHDLWDLGGGDVETTAQQEFRLRLETDRYEVAVALDISTSMADPLSDGVVKLDGLKDAVVRVADIMQTESATTPGGILVSIVPFSAAVNVADTCNADPQTGACRAARSAGKERYVRMLAGVRDSMADTLADARSAERQGTGAHWVDTFHHYGVASGALRHRYLPTDLLNDRDWNLRRTNVNIDVSGQLPRNQRWRVDDEDFWNGCVMARWGAYWNDRARTPGWSANDSGNWPAAGDVPGWTPASPALSDTPLHLSDAAPDTDAPNTLFTAFSWPDAWIGGAADQMLRDTAVELLHPGVNSPAVAGGDNDWSAAGKGGDAFCPRVPITPLTDDLDVLRRTAANLEVAEAFTTAGGDWGATFMNLGVVWGLRTLSPLWQGVWDVRDIQNAPRPGVPCAPGEPEADCDGRLNKLILIVSDGTSQLGYVVGSRLLPNYGDLSRPSLNTESVCNSVGLSTYHQAEAATTPAAYNDYFRAPHVAADLVDANDRLNAHGRVEFASAFLDVAGRRNRAVPRNRLANALRTVAPSAMTPTPWQLFRGLDAEVAEGLVASNTVRLEGRPVLAGPRCGPTSLFSPYGRADDLIYVGADTTPPGSELPPVADAAPLEIATLSTAIIGNGLPGSLDEIGLRRALSDRIDEWLVEACAVAGERRVRVHAVFMGDSSGNDAEIDVLERCVDAAGGDPQADDVFVTPTSADLTTAFEQVFTFRRNLRFVN